MKLFGITIDLKAAGRAIAPIAKAAAPIVVAVIAHKATTIAASGGIKGVIAAAVEAEVAKRLA